MIDAAVVGYGYSGRALHSYLISLEPGIRLYAISTRDPERQRQAAHDYPEAMIYGGINELLTDERVDLVVLATPHHTHHELAIQAMEAGKHVVTDKVMCMNAHQAEEMIAASVRNQVLLSVFQNRRWDWGYMTVQHMIKEGLLGTPYYFRAGILNYRPPGGWRGVKVQSGGILYDWPAHFVDQALQLVDAPVISVYCDIKYRDHWNTDIGNYAKLLLNYENDVLFEIEIANLAAIKMPRWYVAGDLGALIKYGIDPQEPALRQGHIETAAEKPEERVRVVTYAQGEREERVVDSVRGSWTAYYRNIAAVLNQGAELAVKPGESLAVMRVYDAAMHSAATGETVML